MTPSTRRSWRASTSGSAADPGAAGAPPGPTTAGGPGAEGAGRGPRLPLSPGSVHFRVEIGSRGRPAALPCAARLRTRSTEALPSHARPRPRALPVGPTTTTGPRPPTGRTTRRQSHPRPCCGSRLSQCPMPALRAAACGSPVPDGEQDATCGETTTVPKTAEAAFDSAQGRDGREHLKAGGLPPRDPSAPAVPDPVVGGVGWWRGRGLAGRDPLGASR